MLTDEELEALSSTERAALARRLAVLAAPLPPETPTVRRRRRLFIDLLVVCCIVLIPWIAFLGFSLPPRYVAGHWGFAWVGFDIVLLAGLATTAWAAWRRRQIVVVASLVTGTLLCTDAWFDVVTSATHGVGLASAADALLVELPLAGLLFYGSARLLRILVAGTRKLAGATRPELPFWKVPLFTIDDPSGPML